ncbi:hypothetical protein DICVIV_13321 [Dictyocaulus viviparus]|uniref:Uncharacterized protein n=1 Tax=Dictyocaulus viviparus TaxID=29172 RepID=A0A0D8XAE9_DICVI|nr:hypothetical protein DICVIV_13321 [Dictyocaulus viviparus]
MQLMQRKFPYELKDTFHVQQVQLLNTKHYGYLHQYESSVRDPKTGFRYCEVVSRFQIHFNSFGPKKENLLIKFPSYKTAGVQFHEETNALGHKCFRMSGGRVEVYPPGLSGSKKYYVHLETRIGIHGKPERCVNADSNGCGGIGSWYEGNRPAQCSKEGLAPGSYNDIALKVCLPTKSELLPFLDQNSNRAEQLWDLFVSSRARSGEIPLVIAARIFDHPINNLSPKDMNDLLHNTKEGMIGCHWIYATVSQQN